MPHLVARPLTTLVIEDQDELNELLVSTIRSEGYVSGGVRSVEEYERRAPRHRLISLSLI